MNHNRFKLKAIHMLRYLVDQRPDVNVNSLSFENLDNKEMQGTILSSSKTINWIFCNHPLEQRNVDDDYIKEYESCLKKYSCILFSYEDLEQEKLSLYGNEIQGLTIYRGWMMKPQLYKIFYEKLKERNIILVNSPEEYEKYHMLPGWYYDFEEYTAKSAWTSDNKIDNAIKLLDIFDGSVVVKDYVKSRKHEWYDACYIPDAKDIANGTNVIINFINRQGENLVGGIVLREFLELNSIGYYEKSGMPISEEYRVFILGGKVKVIGNYWGETDNINLSENDIDFIEEIARKVKSNFITLDIARCKSGDIKIIELGDGQVSGLQQIEALDFFDNILDYKPSRNE